MGVNWLSVFEAARVIGVEVEEVERMVDDERLRTVWFGARGCSLCGRLSRRPYVLKSQAEELALTLGCLEAAVADWEEKGC